MKLSTVASCLLLLAATIAQAADLEGTYANLYDQTELRLDPNAGLTIFPTLLVPAGGRIEGMGTAYAAVSGDSGFIEGNPSASSRLNFTELAFLHNNWIADTRIEGVVFADRFDDFGVGFAGKVLYVPFEWYDLWGVQQAGAYVSETVATVNASYNFLNGYDFNGIAVGANLKLAYRNIPSVFATGQSAFTAMFDLGVLTEFDLMKFFVSRERNFSVGAAVKNLGPQALGEPLPTFLATGMAYSPIRPVTIAWDFNVPFSLSSYPAEQWWTAGGIDVVVTNFLSVHSGFRYRSGAPRLSVGSSLELEQMRLVANYVLDLADSARFSVEATLNLGDKGRAERQSRVDELYREGLAAYANGDLERAVLLWEEILEISPGFTPAVRNLELLRNLVQLQNQMEQLQIGDD